MPALAGYRSLAPDVELDISLTDRNVGLVEEGFDLAFRIGAMSDTSMIARPLRPYRMVACAAPGYLARRGTPSHPSELEGHEAIAFTPSARLPWRFTRGEEDVQISPARMITVNNGQAVRSAARAGLGVVVQPEILLKLDIEAGCLTRLFADWQLGERPMWLLYYRDRRVTPRLRSFISFAVAAFGSSSSLTETTTVEF